MLMICRIPIRQSRFKIHQTVPGTFDKDHLDILVVEVQEEIVSNQVWLVQIEYFVTEHYSARSRISTGVRLPGILGGAILWAFLGPTEVSWKKLNVCPDFARMLYQSKNNSELKRIFSFCCRAITKFKKRCAILNRTGNTGPPDSALQRSLRSGFNSDALLTEIV